MNIADLLIMTHFPSPVNSTELVVYTPNKSLLEKAEAHLQKMQNLFMAKSFKSQVSDYQHFHSRKRDITVLTDKSSIANAVRTVDPMAAHTKKRLDDFLQAAVEKNHFSGVAMVVSRGKVLLNRGCGSATTNDKNEQDTITHVGSITKQFTAAAIMKFSEAGIINLDASINTYLPKEYQSNTWEKVKVRHLLSHTSGIVDYDESYYDAETKGFCFNNTIKTMIFDSQKKELEFEPGTQWHYCNIGYTLLGSMLENITGRSCGEVIQKCIFEKVGMSASFIHEENYAAKKGHAVGLRWDGGQKKLIEDNEKDLPVTPADGGLVTTSEDLYKWRNVLGGNRPDVLSPDILKQMTTPAPNTFTSDGGYGYGLFIDDSSGTRRIHHPGWIPGFRSHFCFYPEKEIYISVFCNNSKTDPMQITSGLSEIMGEKWTVDNPNLTPPLSEDDMEKWKGAIGKYHYQEHIIEVSSLGEKIFVQIDENPPFELTPLTTDIGSYQSPVFGRGVIRFQKTDNRVTDLNIFGKNHKKLNKF